MRIQTLSPGLDVILHHGFKITHVPLFVVSLDQVYLDQNNCLLNVRRALNHSLHFKQQCSWIHCQDVDGSKVIQINVSIKKFPILNYVAHSRSLSYLGNVHTDTSGAEPETFHTFTVGSDAFIAPNSFADVLWVLT